MKAALIVSSLVALQAVSMDAPAKPKQHVVFVAEPQTVAAGTRAMLDLRFHVDDGFHVNSHTPRSELLIGTLLELGASAGVKVAPLEYPPGKLYTVSFDPSDKLDVYSGDFIVKAPVIATAGEHELKGQLTYQACDRAACYPPRTLAVDVLFTAK